MKNTGRDRDRDRDRDSQWDIVAKMLGLTDKAFSGGIERCDISMEQLTILLDMGFTWFEYKFNNSPTIENFFKFGKLAESCGANITFIGFLESKYRENARIVIEGIKVTNFPDTMTLILNFAQSFHDADEFTANSGLLRAWYD
jgi:hypothetical protein